MELPKYEPREKFLVKWKLGSYKNLTWEWAEAIDDDMKIAMFKRIETPPTGVGLQRSPKEIAELIEKRKIKKAQFCENKQ